MATRILHLIKLIFQVRKMSIVCLITLNPDKVVNLAAQAGVRYSIENPHEYVQSNIVGFTNIIESCRYNGVSGLIYASSLCLRRQFRNPFLCQIELINQYQFTVHQKIKQSLLYEYEKHLWFCIPQA